MTDTTEAQINALEHYRETEEADVDFLLAQLGINMDSIAARTAVRSFRKKNIQLGVIHAAAANAAQPPPAPVETCANCNGTKKAIYFSEQAMGHEERDCHVCRPRSPAAAPVETDIMGRSVMQRFLAAAGWDAGSLRHKQLEDALDGAHLQIVPKGHPRLSASREDVLEAQGTIEQLEKQLAFERKKYDPEGG